MGERGFLGIWKIFARFIIRTEVVPVMASKNPIKCIAFDIGGTLHRNTQSSKMLGWKMKLQVLADHGYPTSFETYKKAMDAAWVERNAMQTRGRFLLDALSLKKLGIPATPELTGKMTRAFFEWRLKDMSPRRISPGVKSMLRFLAKKEIITGVISDSDLSWSRVWLKNHKIPMKEHRIIISNEVNTDKQNVKIFKLFLSRLREEFPTLKPSQILMIGDQSRDMNAKKAGFQTCWYNPSKKPLPKEWKIKPDFEIAHFKEIKKLL